MQPALQVQALFKVGLAAPRWGVCCIQPQGIQGDDPQGLGSWCLLPVQPGFYSSPLGVTTDMSWCLCATLLEPASCYYSES